MITQWESLSRTDLKRAVAEAAARSLTVEETQMLEAARERLDTWPEPNRTAS